MTPRGRKAFELSDRLKLDMNTMHGMMINLFEDACINNIDTGKFLGMDETLHGYLGDSFEDIFHSKKAKDNMWYKSDLSKEEEILGTSILMSGKAMESYVPDMIGRVDPLLDDPKLNPRFKELFDKASKKHLAGLKNEIENVETSDTQNVWDWMNNYLQDLWEISPPPPQNGKGEGEKGEGKGEEEGKGEASEGESKKKDGEIDESTGKAVKDILEEWLDDHKPDLNKRRNHRDMYYDPPDPEKGSRKYDPPSAENFIVTDFKNKQFSDGTMMGTRSKASIYSINFNDRAIVTGKQIGRAHV